MPDVTVDSETYERLRLAARVARISVPEVIRRLADEAAGPDVISRDAMNAAAGSAWVPVFTRYQRRDITGELDPSTGRVRVTAGALDGKTFDTPSAAAMAVIRLLNPERSSPHTNGWRFWKDTASRRPIGDLYQRRASGQSL